MGDLQHKGVRFGVSRAVICNGICYFTGHVAHGKQATVKEQTAEICARYDAVFAEYGLNKKNIIYNTTFLTDMSKVKEYEEVFFNWVDIDTPPAGVAVQSQFSSPDYLIEMALTVAVG